VVEAVLAVTLAESNPFVFGSIQLPKPNIVPKPATIAKINERAIQLVRRFALGPTQSVSAGLRIE
jgi:hypothetical protein